MHRHTMQFVMFRGSFVLYSKMLCAGIYFACNFSEALLALVLDAGDVLINYQA